jgi:hypothetical protein
LFICRRDGDRAIDASLEFKTRSYAGTGDQAIRGRLSPRPAIDGMARIKWPTVHTDVRRVAVDFQEALAAIMARLAQALQLPKEELVNVSLMRLDMVRNRRWHHLAAAEAEPTKGMFTQLMQALPVC